RKRVVGPQDERLGLGIHDPAPGDPGELARGHLEYGDELSDPVRLDDQGAIPRGTQPGSPHFSRRPLCHKMHRRAVVFSNDRCYSSDRWRVRMAKSASRSPDEQWTSIRERLLQSVGWIKGFYLAEDAIQEVLAEYTLEVGGADKVCLKQLRG